MQHDEAHIFGGFLGAQQRLAPPGGDCLVRFDAPEARVLVAQVAEAGDQKPLVRLRAGAVVLAARVPGRQADGALLERDALLEERREGLRDDAGGIIGDAQLGGRRHLGRDVAVHHDAGVHRDEIDHAHVGVQPHHRLVDHAALVHVDQVERGLGLLRLLLVPGDEDGGAQRGERLHRGDAGAGRDARRHLDGQPGDARRFQGALQPVIAPEHGVALVDMAAPEEVHLFAAVDDLPVGEIGVLALDQRLPARLAVERQGEAVLPGELHQARQQPGIAPLAEDQVGVVALEEGAQVDHQRAQRLEGQAVVEALVAQAERGGGGMAGVAIRLQVKDAQRRQLGIQLPGGIEGFDIPDQLALDLHAAARHGEGAAGGGVAQRELQVGIVVIQLGEGLRDLAEEARLLRGGGLHAEHGDRIGAEDIAALIASQLDRHGLAFQPAPERAQPFRGTGGVEGDREGLVQAAAGAVVADQPEHQPVLAVLVEIEQPAGELSHSGGAAPG